MVTLPPGAPITRREFHMELMILWLFVLFASVSALDDEARWTSLLAPVFTLVMVGVHALALRRATSSPTAPH